MPKGSSISPLRQSGSWSLKDYLIVVGKLGAEVEDYYPVEIVEYSTNNRVYGGNISRLTPCRAALSALVQAFGRASAEVDEFEEHYACEKEKPPAPKGWPMTDDLEGSIEHPTPAWIRR